METLKSLVLVITALKNRTTLFLLVIFIILGNSCKSKKAVIATAASPKQFGQRDYSLFFKAERFYQNGKYSQSREIYRKLSSTFTDSSGIWARIANCYAKQNDFSQALLTLDTALNKEPRNTDYLHLKALWLAKNSRSEEAANAYLKLSSKNTKSWSLVEDAARTSYNGGNHAQLIEICDTWTTRFDLNDRVAFYYMHAYEKQNDTAKIMRLLNQLETKYPDRMRYGKKRLSYFSTKGYYTQASLIGKSVYKNFPNDNMVVSDYLKACFFAENWEEAMRILEDISQNKILAAETAKNGFLLLGREKELFPAFDRLLDSANQTYGGRYTWDLFYGDHISKTGDNSLKIKLLKKTVEEQPSNIQQWETLLQLLYFTSDIELKDYVMEFTELYPFMNIGKLYSTAAGIEPQLIIGAIQDEYLSAITSHTLWKKENKKTEALRLLEKECMDTRNPIILLWMHQLATGLNKTIDAQKYLKKALKNGAIIE